MYQFMLLVGLVMFLKIVLALETTGSDTYTKAQRYHLPQLFFGYEDSQRESHFPSPQFDSLDHPAGRESVNYGNEFDDGEEGRLFYFQRRTITVVLTKTSTSTLLDTCTLSTTVCAGRRRRSFLKDVAGAGDQLENISVAPTATQPIEATALAENVVQLAPSTDLVTSSIQPHYSQISSKRRAGIVDSFNKNLFNKGVKSEIQSSLKNNVEEGDELPSIEGDEYATSPHISLDSFHSILGQLIHGMGDYGPPTLIPAELSNRQFIPFYIGAPRFKYVTKWKTASTVFTVTSVPNCSVTGTIKQCP